MSDQTLDLILSDGQRERVEASLEAERVAHEETRTTLEAVREELRQSDARVAELVMDVSLERNRKKRSEARLEAVERERDELLAKRDGAEDRWRSAIDMLIRFEARHQKLQEAVERNVTCRTVPAAKNIPALCVDCGRDVGDCLESVDCGAGALRRALAEDKETP